MSSLVVSQENNRLKPHVTTYKIGCVGVHLLCLTGAEPLTEPSHSVETVNTPLEKAKLTTALKMEAQPH